MSKCLVLGANGFIGSHLVDSLVERGKEVRAFDRFSDGKTIFEMTDAVEIMPGDFLNRSDLARAIKGVDFVFHFISTTTPATAESDPLIDIETNVRMSVELFQECVNEGVKKVIFASTGGAVYGDLPDRDILAEDDATLPVSPYAIGKLTIEHYLRYFEKKFDLTSVTYRISNPYGERQSMVAKQGVIPIFLHHIYKHEPITVLGDGSMVRDYLYVKDVAELISQSFESASRPVYNLGSGTGVSVNGLIESIQEVTGQQVRIEYRPKPATFVQKVVLNTDRFKSEFNLEPEVCLDAGLRKTWGYIKNYENSIG
jgi:UDP-glucose 4-epimerase